MKVHIQSRHFELTEGLKAHIQRKLKFALSRMESHITAISVCLSDVNGPKGGLDALCQLQVSIANMEDIVIKDRQTDLYCAIDRAMQRASRTVARKVARQQKLQKHPTKVETICELDQEALQIHESY